MRKDLPLILFFLVLGYLIYEGNENGKGARSLMDRIVGKAVNPPYESDFAQGLPAEYAPADPHHFASEEKLASDLNFRRQRMQEQMRIEVEEFKKLKDFEGADLEEFQNLLRHHEAQIGELNRLHHNLREQYRLRKEEDAVRNKDLR
ncbi:hypothetical protein [Peredibacter starrii]|uniref:Periplasmic heavy metal sensor n=1 Tax=Peredibacter starrii TaxID=28202 RepID=A0AAX4HKD3_9BACT|nr:hypothetical protein [Peredibacter starrii]WPU63686.1 hypothetical protein SOO65_13405 [Peredibacter starrii]